MKRTLVKLSLGLSIATTVAGAARADDPVLVATKVTAHHCGTARGSKACPPAVLVTANGIRQALEDKPIRCPGAKPGPLELSFRHDFDEGVVLVEGVAAAAFDHDSPPGPSGRRAIRSTQPVERFARVGHDGQPLAWLHLPTCVREVLIPKVGESILSFFDALHAIDRAIDVGVEYTLSLKIAAPR